MSQIISTKHHAIGPLQSDVLNVSRWVAAFLVVVEHLRSLMFANSGHQAPPMGALAKAYYFATGFGHCAVMVFFVMSGFLVGGKAIDLLLQDKFSWKRYAVDRVSRLYAVYLLALVLGGGLDYLGYHYFNQYGLYNSTYQGRIAAINQSVAGTLNLKTWLVNLGMCQTILGPTLGSNGALWSLANEAWYYLAGPVLFTILFARQAIRRILMCAGLAAIIWFLPRYITFYGLMWLWGAGLYFLNRRPLLPFWLAAPLFFASFGAVRMEWVGSAFYPDFLIALTFGLMINSVAGSVARLPFHAASRRAADFSYSVYLCHLPMAVFAVSALFQLGWLRYREFPSLKSGFIALALLLIIYTGCYVISLITERQTPKIRSWFGRPPVGVPD